MADAMPYRRSDSPGGMAFLGPNDQPTPLLDLPALAAHCGVARIFLKDEGPRFLGSFKVLGGMFASLRALVRVLGLPDLAALGERRRSGAVLPRLLCASDGNHGLAVAAGAEWAGAPAWVYLPASVPLARAQRIADRGAEIMRIAGTYDDAVREAACAAERGEGLLIADTSSEENDPVVADVLAGYGVMAREIVAQLANFNDRPTHLFVQAGVGGLAAALAEGVRDAMAGARQIVVVEPGSAACVGAALEAGRPVRLPGDLITCAEMLSCGEASAPALRVLLRHGARALAVRESTLVEAVGVLSAHGGPTTTPSGAAGLAGLLVARPGTPLATDLRIDAESRILLIASEGAVPSSDLTPA